MSIKQMALALVMSMVISESKAMDIGWRDVMAIAGFTYAVKRLYDRGVEAGLKHSSIESGRVLTISGTLADIETFQSTRNLRAERGITINIIPAAQQPKYDGAPATSAGLGQQYEIHPQHFHPSAPLRKELN